MSIVVWDPGYSVGVKDIDDEHRMLFAMVNKAYDSMGSDHEVMADLVADMCMYAKQHFATEEAYMEKFGFADTGHFQEHRIFTTTVDDFMKQVQANEEVESVEVFKFLANWLRLHIQSTDTELGVFLSSNGVE